MSEKKTVGAHARDLLMKEPDSRDPIEIQREMHKEYEKNVLECLTRHKKIFDGDFFIVVENKKERLMANVIRNYFYGRESCPTPFYDQTVYHYHRSDDHLEFLWVVPDGAACELLKSHALEIPDDQKELLGYVLNYLDGSLHIKSARLNGELR